MRNVHGVAFYRKICRHQTIPKCGSLTSADLDQIPKFPTERSIEKRRVITCAVNIRVCLWLDSRNLEGKYIH